MCSGGCSSNCSCGCEQITLETIAGPTGPQGPAGTSVLYWNPDTLSTATTGSDVLLASYSLPADELETNGDELQIEVTGAWLNNAVRYLKLDINGSAITTVANSTGALTNGAFVCRIIVTRASNTTTEGFAISHWNIGATTESLIGLNAYTTDFTAIQTVRFFINQDVATSVRIDSIKIKKAIF